MVEHLSATLPFYGYRKVALEAAERYGVKLSWKRALRLRQEMQLHAVCLPAPTSTPRTAHRVFPYLLEGKEIKNPN